MVRRISRRLHWPKREHEQKLGIWSDPAQSESAAASGGGRVEGTGVPPSPPWILPPVAKAEPRPEARA